MSKKLFMEHTFTDAHTNLFATTYPVVVTKDNGDGTLQGYYDLDKMSPVKKVLAIANEE